MCGNQTKAILLLEATRRIRQRVILRQASPILVHSFESHINSQETNARYEVFPFFLSISVAFFFSRWTVLTAFGKDILRLIQHLLVSHTVRQSLRISSYRPLLSFLQATLPELLELNLLERRLPALIFSNSTTRCCRHKSWRSSRPGSAPSIRTTRAPLLPPNSLRFALFLAERKKSC